MSVRNAEPSDLSQIIELAGRVQPTTRYTSIPIDEPSLRSSVLTHIGVKSQRAYVYCQSGVVKGLLLGSVSHYEWNSNLYWATDDLFIAEAGGAYLLKRFVRWASRIPRVQEIILGASADCELAEEFYQAAGFDYVGAMFAKKVIR